MKEEDDLLGEIEKNEKRKIMAKAVKDALESIPQMATLVRKYYIQLIKEGFREDQAVRIVSAHGFMPPINSTDDK